MCGVRSLGQFMTRGESVKKPTMLAASDCTLIEPFRSFRYDGTHRHWSTVSSGVAFQTNTWDMASSIGWNYLASATIRIACHSVPSRRCRNGRLNSIR